jgi:anti-anti-sigma factor
VNLQIDSVSDVKVVRMKESRLIYPLLGSLVAQISSLIEQGTRKLVMNLSDVAYLDSASYGCLMDIHRMLLEKGGVMKLVGLHDRVATMASMVGITQHIESFREEKDAVNSF